MLILTFLLSAGLSLASEVQHNVRYGEVFQIRSLDYPTPAASNLMQSWMIQSPPGSIMKLICLDIRLWQLNPPSCDDEAVVINDGSTRKELCGSVYDYILFTSSNKLNFEIRTKLGGGGVSCTVTVYEHEPTTTPKPTFPPPEEQEVYLPVGHSSHFLSRNYPDNPPPYVQQTWIVKTEPEARLRINCMDIRTIQFQPPGCNEDYVIMIEDESERNELCGSVYDYSYLSNSPAIRITFKSGQYPGAFMKCKVEAKEMAWYGEATPSTTTTSTLPPYLGIESEEIDSSEYGGPKGPKDTTCPCGWANKPSKRIVNGVESGINEFPWMVALIHRERQFQFCGGSIISPYHVLTAAHCTEPYYTEPLAVVIGDHNLYKDDETNATKQIGVRRIIQHSKYNGTAKGYDIALLLLEEKIEYNRLVGPVCLTTVYLDLVRQYTTVIGWGRLQFRGPSPETLQKLNSRVIHLQTCRSIFRSMSKDEDIQMCTYSHKKASCQGDSGGPVVWLDPETNRYVLVGIVSFGSICADQFPSVNTDVGAFYGWIQENIRDTLLQETCSKVES